MTDPAKDFRYILDGEEVEAYQITEESRYAQSLWPEWLDSRQFITQDGAHYYGESEQPVPLFYWMVLRRGAIEIMSWQVMETAQKVVPFEPEVFEESDDEQGIAPIEQAAAAHTSEVKLLTEVTMAFEMLTQDEVSAGTKILREALASRTTWCNCSPGECKQVGEKIGCRMHSPLVNGG